MDGGRCLGDLLVQEEGIVFLMVKRESSRRKENNGVMLFSITFLYVHWSCLSTELSCLNFRLLC